MSENKERENLELLIKLSKEAKSQRKLASEVGFSLGKINYCLKALKNKGLIKLRNFKNNQNKLNYVYILTPKGISKKTELAVKFMKKKMKEYDELKNAIEKDSSSER